MNNQIPNLDNIEGDNPPEDIPQIDNMADNKTILPRLKLDAFDPGTHTSDPTTFIENYEMLANAGGWKEPSWIQYFPLYLASGARDWYKTIDEITRQRWVDVRTSFLRAFLSPNEKEKHLNRMYNRTLQDGETMSTYVFDMIGLCNRYDPTMSEDDKISTIKRGLPAKFNQQLIGHKINTLQELQDILFKMQDYRVLYSNIGIVSQSQSQSSTLASTSNSSQCHGVSHISIEEHESKILGAINEVKKEIRQNNLESKNPTTSRNRDDSWRDKIQCFNCNKMRHFDYECSEPPTGNEKANRERYMQSKRDAGAGSSNFRENRPRNNFRDRNFSINQASSSSNDDLVKQLLVQQQQFFQHFLPPPHTQSPNFFNVHLKDEAQAAAFSANKYCYVCGKTDHLAHQCTQRKLGPSGN